MRVIQSPDKARIHIIMESAEDIASVTRAIEGPLPEVAAQVKFFTGETEDVIAENEILAQPAPGAPASEATNSIATPKAPKPPKKK